MKIQLCTIALSGMLATGVVFAQAAGSMDNGAQQGSNMQQGSGMHHQGMESQSPDQRLARMTKKYNLTADQQSQIKPILEDEQKQMQAMHSDTSMAPKDRQEKWKSMRDTDSQKIEAVLNDNQKKMFEADQQKMEQKMSMRHQQGMQGSSSDQQSAPQQ